MQSTLNALSGKRILVVEDEYLVAMETARVLENAGAVVVGPVGLLRQARAVLQSGEELDAALLDVNLGDGIRVDEVAVALRGRGVPIVFQTGYGADALPQGFSDVRRLMKPAPPDLLVQVLAEVLNALSPPAEERGSGSAAQSSDQTSSRGS
jgi:CheY-like chemotaxis protein